MRVLVSTALPAFLAASLLIFSSFTWAQTEPVDTTITIDNAASNAYILVAADGERVGEIGSENTGWTLQIGHRYRVVNNGELLFHPFELRSDEDVLLAQGETEGTFEENKDVKFTSDDVGVSFTLTPELAEVLTSYRCAYHPRMMGLITAKDGL